MQRVHDKPIDSNRESPESLQRSIKEKSEIMTHYSKLGTKNKLLPETQEPSIETDKLSYEIFNILESKFLFGYDVEPKPAIADPKHEFIGNGTVTGSVKNQRGKICVLSIDGGGGMRGILPGKALAYLEHALKSKSGDPNARIADYFDVAAGTGIGGVFTAMLFGSRDGSRPIFRAEDTWRFLTENGHTLYPKKGSSFLNRVKKGSGSGSGRTGTARVEKAMREAFSELTLKDTAKPVLIPCYDLSSASPFVFSRADALESDSYDFRLWEVCRATWAEPGLFEPVAMRSVDGRTACVGVGGGLAAMVSNPTAAAITHVLHNKEEFPHVRGVEDLMVVSLGTGSGQGVGDMGCSDVYKEVKKWKHKHWARHVATISADGSSDTVDQAVAMAFGHLVGSNYVRIQLNGSSFGPWGPNVDLDPSPGNVKMLVGAAEEVLKQKNVESVLFRGKRIGEHTNAEKLDWLAGDLVLERHRRSSRLAPTVVLKQKPNSTRPVMSSTAS